MGSLPESATVNLTSAELIDSAFFLRRYAVAVETKLYIVMKVDAAHEEIKASLQLADRLETAAKELT